MKHAYDSWKSHNVQWNILTTLKKSIEFGKVQLLGETVQKQSRNATKGNSGINEDFKFSTFTRPSGSHKFYTVSCASGVFRQ